jgi:hypothetical protein
VVFVLFSFSFPHARRAIAESIAWNVNSKASMQFLKPNRKFVCCKGKVALKRNGGERERNIDLALMCSLRSHQHQPKARLKHHLRIDYISHVPHVLIASLRQSESFFCTFLL